MNAYKIEHTNIAIPSDIIILASSFAEAESAFYKVHKSARIINITCISLNAWCYKEEKK